MTPIHTRGKLALPKGKTQRRTKIRTAQGAERKQAMMRTALCRIENGNLVIKRYDDYKSQKEMREDLMGNGFKVLKIWNGNKNDEFVSEWEFINRK